MSKSFQNTKYFKKAQITKKMVKKNTDLSITEFVEKEGWKEDTELISNLINDKLTDEEVDYLEERLDDLDHLKDNRSNEEYALDLVTGWLIEDTFIQLLKDGHNVERSSADKEREFLENPDADSDLAVKLDGDKTPIEVTHDNTGFWQRTGIWSTLRDSKFENLKKEEALILGLDMKNEEIFLIQAANADKIGKEYNRRIGKKASKINLEAVSFHKLSELKEVLGRKISETLTHKS